MREPSEAEVIALEKRLAVYIVLGIRAAIRLTITGLVIWAAIHFARKVW